MFARLAILLSLLLAMPSLAEDKVARYPEVFTSDDYTITVVSLGEDEALIEVAGVNDEALDKKIFRHAKKCQTRKCEHYIYATADLPEKDNWWTLEIKDANGWYPSTFIYPGMAERTPVYKAEKPKDFDSKAFYQRYLGQANNKLTTRESF